MTLMQKQSIPSLAAIIPIDIQRNKYNFCPNLSHSQNTTVKKKPACSYILRIKSAYYQGNVNKERLFYPYVQTDKSALYEALCPSSA